MALIGDPEREQTVDLLRGAYARGYLSPADLEVRVSRALAAESPGDLRASVQGIPGGTFDLVVATRVEPVVQRHGAAVKRGLASAIRWLAIAFWIAASAILLLMFGVWSLASGLSVEVAVGFLVVWLAVSLPPALLWRKTRQPRRR